MLIMTNALRIIIIIINALHAAVAILRHLYAYTQLPIIISMSMSIAKVERLVTLSLSSPALCRISRTIDNTVMVNNIVII